jgi:hypothetical protein
LTGIELFHLLAIVYSPAVDMGVLNVSAAVDMGVLNVSARPFYQFFWIYI